MTERPDELGALKADWRRQDTRIDALSRELEGVRRGTRMVLALEILLTLAGILLGCFYAVAAWRDHDVLFALSAWMLLVVVPPLAIPGLLLRHRSLDFPDRTPEGTLRYALQRLKLASRILRMQQVGNATLLAFVACVWASAALGWIPRRYPLVTLTVVWLLSVLAAELWCRRRLRHHAVESARCSQLLASFRIARQAESEAETGGPGFATDPRGLPPA